jgi:tRNA (uracil-5-)-methyltransferase TRM9
MNETHVHKVYESIAGHFSDTRYNIWPCIARFLDSLSSCSLVGDIGCGNGKNMLYRRDLEYSGCDITENLLLIAKEKTKKDVVHASGISLPYRDEVFDATMSVAVVHHLNTTEDRQIFVNELVRCTRIGGNIIFTVWILDQPYKKKWQTLGGGDFFIPWTDKSGITYNRFYHFFTKDEIIDLIPNSCELVSLEEEAYNYVIVIRKMGY